MSPHGSLGLEIRESRPQAAHPTSARPYDGREG